MAGLLNMLLTASIQKLEIQEYDTLGNTYEIGAEGAGTFKNTYEIGAKGAETFKNTCKIGAEGAGTVKRTYEVAPRR